MFRSLPFLSKFFFFENGARSIALFVLLSLFRAELRAAESHRETPCANALGARTQQEHWSGSAVVAQRLVRDFPGRESYVTGILVALLAGEHVFASGPSGGAKTFIARRMLSASLRALPAKEKATFVLQFHKLLTEGVITGFQNLQAMLDEDRFEIDVSESLVADRFFFALLDEVEKANPATLSALLGVLQERRAFLGSRVVEAVLRSAILTSNKTLGAFVRAFGEDRPTGEALVDRTSIIEHVGNQQIGTDPLLALIERINETQTPGEELGGDELGISELGGLLESVRISDVLLESIARVIFKMDVEYTTRADASLARIRQGERVGEFFPPNQFSNRSNLKLVTRIIKAAFLVDQLLAGTSFDRIRFEMAPEDLIHLGRGVLMGGPGNLRYKRVKIDGVPIKLGGPLSIYAKQAIWYTPQTGRIDFAIGANPLTAWRDPATQGFRMPEGHENAFGDQNALKLLLDNVTPPDPTDLYEDDGVLNEYLSWAVVSPDESLTLETIRELRGFFLGALRLELSSLTMGASSIHSESLRKRREKISAVRNEGQALQERLRRSQESGADEESVLALKWEMNSLAIQELSLLFPGQDHVIDAILRAALSSSHILLFGPPGAAKTLVARILLEAFLSTLKERDPKEYRMFFLQFNKLLPIGTIRGFEAIGARLRGETKISYENTLVDPLNIYVILDEVEKGNQAVLTALLSLLEERAAFNGTVVAAGLRTAILTSNKMPAEFEDSFGEDSETAAAIRDRVRQEVYVSNKFPSARELAEFLIWMENYGGKDLRLVTPLDVPAFQSRLSQVTIDPFVKDIALRVRQSYLRERHDYSNKSRQASLEDPLEHPFRYLPAAMTSDRSAIKMFSPPSYGLAAALLVSQMRQGVKLNQARLDFQMNDLGLISESLAYGGPIQLEARHSGPEGLLQFEVASERLGGLESGGHVNARNRKFLGDMREEYETLARHLNRAISGFVVSYRQLIGQFPGLFPEIASDEIPKARQ